jgi:hypothetical protein
MKRLNVFGTAALMVGLFGFLSGPAIAATDCTFTNKGATMSLDADCTTDATILVTDGWTLDGRGYSITAVDPDGGHFLGAVVMNGGSTAYVTKLVVQAIGLSDDVCHNNGPDRLRGIMFDGASGSITHNTVQSINQGQSGCQEGNAIEVQNESDMGTVTVEITHNEVEDYQKGGIICNGDVDCSIRSNTVGESYTQLELAANTLQIAFGGTGTIENNRIAGNQWLGESNFVATAVLIFEADGVTIQRNNIRGNSDVGVVLWGEDGILDNNQINDEGPDGNVNDWDVGVWAVTTTNVVTKNKIRGFDVPTVGVDENNLAFIDGGQVMLQPVCFGSSPDCGIAVQ